MRTKQLCKTNPHVAAEFTRLFGPPPLLQIEDTKVYEAILEGLAREERPQTLIARILIRDLADLVYQRLWLGGLGMRLIKHVHRSKKRFDHAQVMRDLDEIFGEAFKKSDSMEEEAIEHNDEGIGSCEKSKVPELTQAEAAPIDEAAIFAEWIGGYERVQRLLAAADKRLKDTLKLLDEYREGLGQRVYQLANSVAAASLEPLCSPKRRQLQRLTGARRSASTTSRSLGRSNQRAQSAAKRSAIT